MANDDTFPSENTREHFDLEGLRIGFPSDEFGEVRICVRNDASTDEDSKETERELRVSRHDEAAARCGRWGDEQWR